MEIEGSTSTSVFNPELRGLVVRLRLSRNSDQGFSTNSNEDFVGSSEEIGMSFGFSYTIQIKPGHLSIEAECGIEKLTRGGCVRKRPLQRCLRIELLF